MRKPQTALRDWLQATTPTQAREVAKAAETSVPHLRHIAHGRRNMSAELAQRLAHASKELKHRALYLDQRELCVACARCPIAR
jgi:transcriptional regulator with XRE-family HTH domain